MGDNNSIRILTINSGSSSLKFALYDMGEIESLVLSGSIDKLDSLTGLFHVENADAKTLTKGHVKPMSHKTAVRKLIEWLNSNAYDKDLNAVGHRVVHGGGKFKRPQLVSPELTAYLTQIAPFAPNHLPQEIKVIKAISKVYPSLKQAACFDTAFHRDMPDLAQTFALPGFLKEEGIIRYGFHGLSYEYIMSKLENVAGPETANGRVIIAHLGSGASMAAVKGGKCIDTTMGFTPTGGLMMSTRCGDLDPGVIIYLLGRKGFRPSIINDLVNRRSGLLGVSGTSPDMEELLKKETENPQAAEAVDLFCYQAKKFLGALAAVLSGLDTLVFTAGIGEKAPSVRRRICKDMSCLGIRLDPDSNESNAPVISRKNSPVTVRVMKTNEELMIARQTYNLINKRGGLSQ